MKLLITADPHFSSQAQDSYRWRLFEHLREAVKKHKPNAVFILGDLTEKKDNHSAKLVNQLVYNLALLAKFSPVHIIKGNHDYHDPRWPFFEFLHSIPNVHFYAGPATVNIAGKDIYLIPHTVQFEKMLRGVPSDARYLFFHQPVRGSKLYGKTELNTKEAIDPALFDRFSKKTLIVAGDIHTPQRVGRMIFAGSPHPVDHGDDFQPRLLLLRNSKVASIPLETIEKASIKTDSADSARHRIKKLNRGDMAIINVKQTQAQLADWPNHRRRLLKLAKQRGIIISDITASVDKTSLPTKHAASDSLIKTLKSFCKSRKIRGSRLKAGLRIVKHCDKLVAHRNQRSSHVSPKSLMLQGFKNFTRRQMFRFGKPGLYQITGDNLIEPRLGANATGKSTLFGALSWCGYDKTERGLRATDIKSWKGKDKCLVGLRFNKDQTLIRSWQPNRLSFNGHKIDQAQTNDLLGLSHEEFLHSILMGQFNSFFFDLKPTDKLNLFSGALGLDRWLSAADLAKKELRIVEMDLETTNSKKEQLVGEYKQAKRSLGAIYERWAASKRGKKVNLKAIQQELSETSGILLAQQACLEEDRRAITEAERTLDAVGNRKEDIELMQSQLAASSESLERKTDELLLELRREKKDEIKSRCRACRHKLSLKAIKLLKMGKERIIRGLRAEIRRVRKQRKQEDKQFDLLSKTRTYKIGRLEKICESIKKLCDVLQKRSDRIARLEKQTTALRIQEGISFQQESEFKKQVELAQAERSKSLAAAVKAKHQFLSIERKHRRIKFWIEKFKEIRLWLVRSALAELEAEVTNNLIALGLENWQITFEVESLTKSGTLSKGFNVFVRSPLSGDNKVKWESWSGGETQRLRAAGAAGFAELIAARSGCRWDIEVWDEPTANLSTEGIDDLIRWLKSRAKDKRVYLIDHRGVESGSFDGRIKVIKTSEGSQISQES